MAKCLQVSQSTISRRLTDLSNWKLIEKLPRVHGHRAQYRTLTLPASKTAPGCARGYRGSPRGEADFLFREVAKEHVEPTLDFLHVTHGADRGLVSRLDEHLGSIRLFSRRCTA